MVGMLKQSKKEPAHLAHLARNFRCEMCGFFFLSKYHSPTSDFRQKSPRNTHFTLSTTHISLSTTHFTHSTMHFSPSSTYFTPSSTHQTTSHCSKNWCSLLFPSKKFGCFGEKQYLCITRIRQASLASSYLTPLAWLP